MKYGHLLWISLFPIEQYRIVCLLIKAVLVREDGIQDLCDANKVTAKYVQLILRLNFLAPKLKEAILLGYQPRHMKLADLMQNIPSIWHEQGESFGCEVIS